MTVARPRIELLRLSPLSPTAASIVPSFSSFNGLALNFLALSIVCESTTRGLTFGITKAGRVETYAALWHRRDKCV